MDMTTESASLAKAYEDTCRLEPGPVTCHGLSSRGGHHGGLSCRHLGQVRAGERLTPATRRMVTQQTTRDKDSSALSVCPSSRFPLPRFQPLGRFLTEGAL